MPVVSAYSERRAAQAGYGRALGLAERADGKALTQQREEHRLDMDAITRRFAAQMAAYDAHFQSLEGGTVVSSEPEVTTERTVHDLGSPARSIVRSSTDSTHVRAEKSELSTVPSTRFDGRGDFYPSYMYLPRH
ncbi:hypothetical protein FH972_019739 [Carpinus fangiana]|uniref:Uncharacterized protein n=1 Tax=Carpinus fangiana TaxID=176857 RepID=A0A5N6RR26_9ROSI|nr:hypothetical protein FH972_019739 [Carpinus fangiana]